MNYHAETEGIGNKSLFQLKEVLIADDTAVIDLQLEPEQTVEAFNHLKTVERNFSNRCLFRFQIEYDSLIETDIPSIWLKRLKVNHISLFWKNNYSSPIIEVQKDIMSYVKRVYYEDLDKMMSKMHKSLVELTTFFFELRYHYTDSETKWFHISAEPRLKGPIVLIDGFIFDVSDLKWIDSNRTFIVNDN